MACMPNFHFDHMIVPVPAEELARLRESDERLKAMLPLFEEARDALCAIPIASAKLHGLRLDLADRMDDVGIPDRWRARQAAKADANRMSSGFSEALALTERAVGDFHDDKISETACNMAVTTQEGDLDAFGRPLRQGS